MPPTSRTNTALRACTSALALLLLALSLLRAAHPVAAQQAEPDLQAYSSMVREALAAARRGDRLGLEASGAALAAVTRVHLPGGESVAVDNRWLADEIARPAPDTALIAERLGALADALAQPPGAAPADSIERLRHILSAPPYARSEASPPPAWMTDLLSWLGRLIERLLSPLGSLPSGTGSSLAWAIAAVGILLVLGVILSLALRLRRGLVGEAARPEEAEEVLTAREAIDQAGELARGGDYRAAVRYLYLAALLRLDERGMLRYDRALTNREYLDRTRDNPALRAALTPIVETFDTVWYGHVALTRDDFESFRDQVERLGRDS
jgi:hypothetical protein